MHIELLLHLIVGVAIALIIHNIACMRSQSLLILAMIHQDTVLFEHLVLEIAFSLLFQATSSISQLPLLVDLKVTIAVYIQWRSELSRLWLLLEGLLHVGRLLFEHLHVLYMVARVGVFVQIALVGLIRGGVNLVREGVLILLSGHFSLLVFKL